MSRASSRNCGFREGRQRGGVDDLDDSCPSSARSTHLGPRRQAPAFTALTRSGTTNGGRDIALGDVTSVTHPLPTGTEGSAPHGQRRSLQRIRHRPSHRRLRRRGLCAIHLERPAQLAHHHPKRPGYGSCKACRVHRRLILDLDQAPRRVSSRARSRTSSTAPAPTLCSVASASATLASPAAASC